LTVLRFPTVQQETWETFSGRLFSFSTSPEQGSVGYQQTMAAARTVFADFAVAGVIEIPVETVLTVGQVIANA
jgi:hypothetical protein